MLLANGLMDMMCISRKIIVLYIFTLNQYKLCGYEFVSCTDIYLTNPCCKKDKFENRIKTRSS